MDFKSLLQIVGSEPIFETGLLLAGQADPGTVRKQLSRWVTSGKLYQLRRGVYALAPPYQKVQPHPFLIANRLQKGSYVSLQSALAFYGMIPEYTPVTTSVTTRRPLRIDTPLGTYSYRHIQIEWFHTYQRVDLGNGQFAFIAFPEKALLDLLYLEPGAEAENYLVELRLQHLDRLDPDRMTGLIQRAGKPKLERAMKQIKALMLSESAGYQPL